MPRPLFLLMSALTVACGSKDEDKDDDGGDDGGGGGGWDLGMDSGTQGDGGGGDSGLDGGGGDTGLDGGGGDGGGGDGGGGGGSTKVSCAWGEDYFRIDISNGDAAGYHLGFAETTCGGSCWTGEDCGYVGYTQGDGTVIAWCHPLSRSGAILTHVVTIDSLVEGVTTLHSGGLDNTMYLSEVATGFCWTWGEDASYFYDCTDLTGALVCAGD